MQILPQFSKAFTKATKRFLWGYLLLHLLAVAIAVLVFGRIAREQMVQDAQAKMMTMAKMLAAHLDTFDDGLDDRRLSASLQKLGSETGSRFTVIDSEGVVVADSVTGTRDIGLHDTREEILEAKAKGSSFSQRFSVTSEEPMMYYATAYQPKDPNHRQGFLRIAISSASMENAIKSMQRVIWSVAIIGSVLTALLMTVYSARSMSPLSAFAKSARRIGAGDHDTSLQLQHRRDEWGELADAFEQMQEEIQQREERLLENSQRLEAVLFSMIEGVVGLDSKGKVMLANEAASRMLSLSESELLDRKFLDIVRIPELSTAIQQTQLHRRFSQTEFFTLGKTNRRLSARVSPLANNTQPGIAVVLHDVTELRQLETMRRDFVANVSHELKTPLSSIKAYAETLKMGALYDQEKNMIFVERIESQAEQLESQIYDLLELARVESGTAAFRITRMSLNVVCQKLHRQYTNIAEENGLELQLRLSEIDPIIKADVHAIETILKNLVINAIHYTPTGGSVRIETGLENEEAILRVIDTGIGIAADQQLRIFERFYRVDRARSREKGGTGLGLSIVKHLTQAFDGSVQLESQIGKGSKFRVSFPRHIE